MHKEIIDFSLQIRTLMTQSELVTKSAIESISFLESDIKQHESKMTSFFSSIEAKKSRQLNLNTVIKELDLFLKLIESIENDKLGINQGLIGTIDDYITKLEFLKSMDKYLWLKDINFSRIRNKKFENNIQIYYNKYNNLMNNGEQLICSEFQNIIKHFSSPQLMQNFIEFLILNKFEGQSSNSVLYDKNQNKSDTSAMSFSEGLFLPNETVAMLEQVCWWFLQREQQYELYNDKNQHCDINQKLKFSEIRNVFLKQCLATYFKMSSIGFVKDSNGKFIKHGVSKLFHAATSQLHSQSSSSISSSNKNREGSETDSDKQKSSHRPAEYIEIFAENLDFSLKLLKHENILIQNIYYKSDETRIELISKLTILVIDKIQKECELFFTDSLDFSKLTNISDNVVHAIIRLIKKVQYLKEKTACLQTEDLSSASKLLQFSIRLNEISSQIFSTYLEVIKTGYFNTSEIPYNCSVHDYCLKICDTWRYICHNEKYVSEPVKIVCDTILNAGSSNSFKKNLLRIKDKQVEVDEEQEIINKYQRSRRGNRSNEVEDDTDFENSDKWYFAKYYSFIIERLDNFLIEETIKSCSSSRTLVLSSQATSSVSNSFKNNLRTLRAFIFLINNLAYIMDFLDERELLGNVKKINPNFEDIMQNNIQNNVDRACEIFKYINSKWMKLNSKESELENFGDDQDNNSLKGKSNRNNSMKSIFKQPFADSRKRRDELLLILRETLANCLKIVIEKQDINGMVKGRAHEYLYPVLESLEATGELKQIVFSLNLKVSNTNERSIADFILEEIFPNSNF